MASPQNVDFSEYYSLLTYYGILYDILCYLRKPIMKLILRSRSTGMLSEADLDYLVFRLKMCVRRSGTVYHAY